MNRTIKHVEIANRLDKLESIILDLRMNDGSPTRLVVVQNLLLNVRALIADFWRDDLRGVDPKNNPYYYNHR